MISLSPSYRRNEQGDRDKALVVIKKVVEMKGGNAAQDVVCLCGRIYKDKFNESNYKDIECRDEAIKWYVCGCTSVIGEIRHNT